MPANDYRLVTRWRLPGTPDQISDLLGDEDTLIRSWPSLYKTARVAKTGDERGGGKVMRVETRGHLPYTRPWASGVAESGHPYGYSIDAWGAMIGAGGWTFEPAGGNTRVTYDWQ